MGDEEVDPEKRATLRRFAALGATTTLAGLAGPATADDGDADADRDSDSDARDALLGYVGATPGAHFSQVRDDLRLGTGETQYHLRELEAEGRVESTKDGDYRRYFLAGRFDAFEKRALGYLRRDTPRLMVVELLANPTVTAAELADRLGVSRPTVSNYAGELEAAGLLSRADGYALTEPERLVTLLVRYADSFGPRAASLADEAADLVTYDP